MVNVCVFIIACAVRSNFGIHRPKSSRSTDTTSRPGPSQQPSAGSSSSRRRPKEPNQSSNKKKWSTHVDEGGDPVWRIGAVRMIKITEKVSGDLYKWKGTRNAVFASCARSPDRRLFVKIQNVDKFGREIPTGAGHVSTVSLDEVDLHEGVARFCNDIDKFKAWVYKWTDPKIAEPVVEKSEEEE
jgi:hypothetical protein